MVEGSFPILHYSNTPFPKYSIPFTPPEAVRLAFPPARMARELRIMGQRMTFTLPMNRNATTNRFLARTSRPHHTDGDGNLRGFHALERLLPAARLDLGQASPRFVGGAVSTGPRRRCEPREGA